MTVCKYYSIYDPGQNMRCAIYTNSSMTYENVWLFVPCFVVVPSSGIILGMVSANERRRYYVTPSLIGSAHAQSIPAHEFVVVSCHAFIDILQGCQ